MPEVPRVRAPSALYWRVLVKHALSGPSGPSVLAPAQRGRFRTKALITHPSRHLDDLDSKSVHQGLIRGPQGIHRHLLYLAPTQNLEKDLKFPAT